MPTVLLFTPAMRRAGSGSTAEAASVDENRARRRAVALDRVKKTDRDKEDGEKDQQFGHVAMIAWLRLTGWTASELEKGRREGNPDTPTAYRDNPTSFQRH